MCVARHGQITQNSKFAISLQYLKVMKLIFCMQISMKDCYAGKHQSFLQVDFNTWGIKVSCKVILSLLMAWSSILNVFKVTSLQCLYNISKKKKLGMEFIFLHADQHQSFWKIVFLFLQLRKIATTAFVFYCGARQYILWGSNQV